MVQLKGWGNKEKRGQKYENISDRQFWSGGVGSIV